MITRADAGPSRSRRAFLRRAATFAAATALHRSALAALAPQQGHVTLPFENGDRELVAFPAEAAADRAHQPPAAAGDAVRACSTKAC